MLSRAIHSVIIAAEAWGGEGELIVVCQGGAPVRAGEMQIRNERFPIRFIHQSANGVSRARNLGLELSRYDLIAFTDDDCLVDPSWITAIICSFARYSTRVIFGRVQAAPHPHSEYKHQVLHGPYGWDWHGVSVCGDRCFATIVRPTRVVIQGRCLPYAQIGSSNNFAARKEVFEEHGSFSDRFGAGSAGLSAEDTEWQYRLLRRGEPIAHDPRPLVLHDAWMPLPQASRKISRYTAGTLALFLGHALAGDKIAWRFFCHIASSNCILPLWRNAFQLSRWAALCFGCANGLRLSGHLRRLITSPLLETRGPSVAE